MLQEKSDDDNNNIKFCGQICTLFTVSIYNINHRYFLLVSTEIISLNM